MRRQAANKTATLTLLFFLLRQKMNAKPQPNPSVPGHSSSSLLFQKDLSITTDNPLWSGHMIEGFTLLFTHTTTKQSSSSRSDQTKELLAFRTDSWITALRRPRVWFSCVQWKCKSNMPRAPLLPKFKEATQPKTTRTFRSLVSLVSQVY